MRSGKSRKIQSKLPGVHIPEEIEITTDLQGSVEGKDVVVLAVPSMATQSYGEENVPVCKGRANSGQCGKRN